MRLNQRTARGVSDPGQEIKINIHVPISNNSLRYFEYCRSSYIGLCSDQKRLVFHAYCLDKESYKKICQGNYVSQAKSVGFGRGSGGHAKALDEAVKNLVPGEINIISDTDVVILMEDWDRFLDDKLLNPTGYGLIGIPYEDIEGFSSGGGQTQTYKRIPTATWMAISPRYDFSALNISPDKTSKLLIDNIALSKLYNLPIGANLLKDVGWRIPEFLHEQKVPYYAFDIVKPDSPESLALLGCSPYHDEFQHDRRPFLVHQRGSMKHQFRIDPLSVDFYDACDRYLKQPEWAVFPSSMDRLIALWRRVVSLFKLPFKFVNRELRNI